MCVKSTSRICSVIIVVPMSQGFAAQTEAMAAACEGEVKTSHVGKASDCLLGSCQSYLKGKRATGDFSCLNANNKTSGNACFARDVEPSALR